MGSNSKNMISSGSGKNIVLNSSGDVSTNNNGNSNNRGGAGAEIGYSSGG